jgi:sporulation protein YlmC with PRC-barrel domain
MVLLSDMYGKQIISNEGKRIGTVEDLIIDFEEGKIASMLTVKIDSLIRSDHTAQLLKKNSVSYDRVKNVSETVIVGSESKR